MAEKESEQFDVTRYLLRGPMPELKKMGKNELIEECKMWRNIWNWVPSEVKYYVARVGQMCGCTIRNYKRYLGILLDTHWDLREIELGVYDKAYDITDGQYYFEKKIIKINSSSIIDMQWIAERTAEKEMQKEAEQQTQAPSRPESEDLNLQTQDLIMENKGGVMNGSQDKGRS